MRILTAPMGDRASSGAPAETCQQVCICGHMQSLHTGSCTGCSPDGECLKFVPAETPSETPRLAGICLSAQKIADAIWAVEHAGVYSAASVIEALRAEVVRLQQENAVLKVKAAYNAPIGIEGFYLQRAEQAEAREQATLDALANAIDIIDEIESLGMQSLTTKAQAEVVEMRELLRLPTSDKSVESGKSLPAAGAAAASPKETT